MIKSQRGNLAVEAALALAVAGLLALAFFQIAEVFMGARSNDERAYAQAVATSVASSVQKQAYLVYPAASGGYATSGADIDNPQKYGIALRVENYQAGSALEFSQAYPDSGMQRIHIDVQNPSAATKASVEFFKWNK